MKCKRNSNDWIKSLPESIIKKAVAELSKGADTIVADAKSRCPVKTGNLRDSIKKVEKKDGMSFRVEADAKSKRGKKEYYGKVVEYNPTNGQPYIYPAVEANRKEILDNVSNAIGKACEEKLITT